MKAQRKKIEIKHREDGRLLYEIEATTLRDAVAKAVAAGVDLAGAHLMSANLEGANLEGAYLADADLRDADLLGAYMEGAYMRGADLVSANLEDANLEDANLRGAHLRGANLRGANLADADLEGANLTGVDLEGFDLTDEQEMWVRLGLLARTTDEDERARLLKRLEEQRDTMGPEHLIAWAREVPLALHDEDVVRLSQHAPHLVPEAVLILQKARAKRAAEICPARGVR